jgi:hypothetical protein
MLLLTPISVLLVTLAGRRWGPVVGGRLTALPLTSGPLVLIIACAHGPDAARALAGSVLAGMPSAVVFCAGYLWLATRHEWRVCLPVALAGAATSAALLLSLITLPPLVSAMIVGAAAMIARRVPPSDHRSAAPVWELPVRMAVCTGLVQGLTTLSTMVGPRLAGMLAAFPALACVLAAMAHRRSSGAAIELIRGVLVGLLPTALLFLTLTVA